MDLAAELHKIYDSEINVQIAAQGTINFGIAKQNPPALERLESHRCDNGPKVTFHLGKFVDIMVLSDLTYIEGASSACHATLLRHRAYYSKLIQVSGFRGLFVGLGLPYVRALPTTRLVEVGRARDAHGGTPVGYPTAEASDAVCGTRVFKMPCEC
jgi:hypothetical protein